MTRPGGYEGDEVNVMYYTVTMKENSKCDSGQYVFPSKEDAGRFIDNLSVWQIEKIVEILKHNKDYTRTAWRDFFG